MRTRLLALLTLAALLIAALWLLRSAPPAPPPDAPVAADRASNRTPLPHAPSRSRRPAPSRPAAAPRVPDAAGSAGLTEVARAEPAGADEAEPQDSATPGSGGVKPGVPLTPATLMDSLDEARPAISRCVQDWAPFQDTYSGRLMLSLRLGPEGVTDAALLDVQSIPTEVLGCFGTAVYEVDWPAAGPEGVEVTVPFVVESSPDEGGQLPEQGGELRDKR